MAKRTDLPDFLRDPAQNRFISGALEGALRRGEAERDLGVAMTNTLIERAVEQIRGYFPEQYQDGNGSNVVAPAWGAAS